MTSSFPAIESSRKRTKIIVGSDDDDGGSLLSDILLLQEEKRDFVVLMQQLAVCVGGSAGVFRKHIESAAHFVSMCAEPSLLQKDRCLLDLFMILYMISNLHPRSAEAKASRKTEYDDCVQAIASGRFDDKSKSSILALGLMVRKGLQLAGYADSVIQAIAAITEKLFISFKRELEADRPETVEAYIANRRESVAVPWWINIQLAMLGCEQVNESMVFAASDAVWLINDAVSLDRDKIRGSTNILIHYLPNDPNRFHELFASSLAELDLGLHSLIEQKRSMEAEVVLASVIGNSAVYALMEKYNGWRYAWTTEIQIRMRDVSRAKCLEWTDLTCKHLRDILQGWGRETDHDVTRTMRPAPLLIPSSETLRDPLMLAWIAPTGCVVAKGNSAHADNAEALALLKTEQWMRRLGMPPTAIPCSVKQSFSAKDDAITALRTSALYAYLMDDKTAIADIAQCVQTIISEDDKSATMCEDVIAVCELVCILTRMQAPLNAEDQTKTLQWIVGKAESITEDVAVCSAIAQLAQVTGALEELKPVLGEALKKMPKERYGLGAVQEVVDRAIVKGVCGVEFHKEAAALEGLLASSRISLEPLNRSTKHDNVLLTSAALTTLMALAVVNAHHSPIDDQQTIMESFW